MAGLFLSPRDRAALRQSDRFTAKATLFRRKVTLLPA
jgi:hypothetical protein